jgi:hypothetical protein
MFALCVGAGYSVKLSSAQVHSLVPDFSGQWVRAGKFPESFDPPPNGAGPITFDPAHPHRPSPDGGQSHDGWVADLSNPILKPGTRARMKPIVADEIAGRPHLKMIDRCYPAGVPMILNQRDPVQFLQSPNELTLVYERDALTRHIYLNQPHSKYVPHTWFGESVGHFEGDTLVVDTLGQNDKTYTDHFFTPHSGKIHVIERYKVSADHKAMQVQISVDDPDVFTMPWAAEATYRADRTPYEEVVCAENNRGFDSYPISIPTAAKPDF